MSIKMCVLRTGETVIGDVKEVLDTEQNKSLGYKISNPYTVTYQYANELKVAEGEIEEKEDSDGQYSFRFWAPLSAERDFNFPFEFIDVIYEPHRDVVDSYITVLEHYQKDFYHEFEVDIEDTIVTRPPEEDLTAQLHQSSVE